MLVSCHREVDLLGLQPYGFDVGASECGIVMKSLDYVVEGTRVGGQLHVLTFFCFSLSAIALLDFLQYL